MPPVVRVANSSWNETSKVRGANWRVRVPAAATEWKLGQSRVLRDGPDATLIVYGALAQNVMIAADALACEGINVEVIDARFCKPLDETMLARVLRTGHPVLTIEDHSLQNGFGTAVIEHAVAHHLPTRWLTRLGIPDRLVAHAWLEVNGEYFDPGAANYRPVHFVGP